MSHFRLRNPQWRQGVTLSFAEPTMEARCHTFVCGTWRGGKVSHFRLRNLPGRQGVTPSFAEPGEEATITIIIIIVITTITNTITNNWAKLGWTGL